MPAIHVDGEPIDGLMFFTPRPRENREQVAEMGRAGVRLVTFPVGSWGAPHYYLPDGRCDLAEVERDIEAMLDVHPTALVIPRVEVGPPKWWVQAHPDEAMRHLHATEGMIADPAKASFASQRWRSDLGLALESFIRRLEDRFGDRVLGYHISAGDAQEWSYSWGHLLSDYSAPQREAFRAWLRRRYENDEARLRRVWGDQGAAFDAAEAPADRLWEPGRMSILHPGRERRLLDYLVFHSEVAAEAILHFCGVARRALDSLGRRKLTGAFYGYHFFWPTGLSNFHNCGHHALSRVLASSDVDFLCAPHSYQERHPGGRFQPQIVAHSVTLHGKLFYNEDDTRTFRSAEDTGFGRCPDLPTTVGVLRRNLVGTLAAGGTLWWMEQHRGWFSDERILREISAMRDLVLGRQKMSRTFSSQVAVVVSEDSAPYPRFGREIGLADDLISRQFSELAHTGVPFDTFLAEDLSLVFSRPWSDNYRLVCFPDALRLTEAQRRAVRERVARNGRTLLWVYGAGLMTEDGWSADAMAEATGIHVRLIERRQNLLLETTMTGTWIGYGPAGEVGPILVADDPAAEVLGWLAYVRHGPFPGLVTKAMEGWTSVWSAIPPLPAALLRVLARRAGVHVYSEVGDQVLRDSDLLAVHACSDGQRRISLPSAHRVLDAFTSALVADCAESFLVDLRRGDTGVWRLELPQGADGSET